MKYPETITKEILKEYKIFFKFWIMSDQTHCFYATYEIYSKAENTAHLQLKGRLHFQGNLHSQGLLHF